MAELISDTIGDRWICCPKELTALKEYADDSSFQDRLEMIKKENKKRLADLINEQEGTTVDPSSIFDVQIKRLHGYKRQLLNILHVLHLYNHIREEADLTIPSRTFIFGAKAAPSYHYAKLIIKLINTVARLVNSDPQVNKILKVVFLPNYCVSLAEKIIPATDVSEQISTVSKEASGVGNMKSMMNGAVTLGTLDGANIEIMEEVGPDNIVTFGLNADQVLEYYRHGGYSSWQVYEKNPSISKILDQLVDGTLPAPEDEFNTIRQHLLERKDEFFVLADFAEYANAQQKIGQLYQNRERWLEMSAINIACSGIFSSDRAIKEYAEEIWNVEPFVRK